MVGESKNAWGEMEKAIADLRDLRQFSGGSADFWPAYLAAVQKLTGATRLALLIRSPGQPWRRLADWPQELSPSHLVTTFLNQAESLADRSFLEGCMWAPLVANERIRLGNFVIGARVVLPQTEDCALIGVLAEASEREAREAALRLSLGAAGPEFYQGNLAARQAATNVEKLSSVLDLNFSVSAETRFFPTALVICNSLATRFNCDRVSLGWLERGFVRLRAISRAEHFDRQMAAAQALETAMEEALDQDNEIVWPPPAGASVVARDHGRFAEEHKAGHLCSLPLRIKQRAVAVLTCERASPPFSEIELQQLRLSCDLVAPRLEDLLQRDRWFGARWAARLKERSAQLLGPEHTWAKLLALATTGIVAALIFLRVPYRVEGTFTLKSDEVEYLTAPFDGYIDEVLVRPGDPVKAGQALLKFKTSELALDESFALADLNRYQREAEKARASQALAEMRVAEAMAARAAAQLELTRYRLREATLAATFDGVVIEGDLRERLGAPVKRADTLFQVARVDKLYVEAQVSERDAHEVMDKTEGEISFLARPKFVYPVRIDTFEPAAMTKPEGNVFLLRCALKDGPQSWWRPGMSGVCKISVGRRSLGWVLTHRTVDFLRLKLWW